MRHYSQAKIAKFGRASGFQRREAKGAKNAKTWRYRAEYWKLLRRLDTRVNGLDVATLMRASCVGIHALWLRHGATDWEPASGGLESLESLEGPGSQEGLEGLERF